MIFSVFVWETFFIFRLDFVLLWRLSIKRNLDKRVYSLLNTLYLEECRNGRSRVTLQQTEYGARELVVKHRFNFLLSQTIYVARSNRRVSSKTVCLFVRNQIHRTVVIKKGIFLFF